MLGGEMLVFQAHSHRAIEDKYFLFEGVEVFSVGIFSFGHICFLYELNSPEMTMMKQFTISIKSPLEHERRQANASGDLSSPGHTPSMVRRSWHRLNGCRSVAGSVPQLLWLSTELLIVAKVYHRRVGMSILWDDQWLLKLFLKWVATIRFRMI